MYTQTFPAGFGLGSGIEVCLLVPGLLDAAVQFVARGQNGLAASHTCE